MVSLENFKPRLKELLRRTDAAGLMSEVAWVVAYASASRTRHIKPADLLLPLLQLMALAFSQVQAKLTKQDFIAIQQLKTFILPCQD